MSQSLAQILVHVVFSTQKRFPFLMESDIRQRVHKYIGGICNKLECQNIIVGGVEDHIHLLLRLNKNRNLSEVIEEIKKSSSRWVKTLDESKLSEFHWQRGYSAFSVSQSHADIVKHYIEQQDKHHQKRSYKDELRELLSKYKINYDEKYLWD